MVRIGLTCGAPGPRRGLAPREARDIAQRPTTPLGGPADRIVCPPISARVEHEAELGVVIKRRCHDVPVPRARECILGYTCLNDVTARDLQEKDGRDASLTNPVVRL